MKRANKKNDLSNKGQAQQDKLEDAKRQTELNKERTQHEQGDNIVGTRTRNKFEQGNKRHEQGEKQIVARRPTDMSKDVINLSNKTNQNMQSNKMT